MTPIFPWSAVLGQERLKQALLLCAIDPAIGGVLVRGPRGVAKTTLARAFAELLPGRFVELPLGATEERVTGSLDLGRALQQGEVQFSPGLLARAHDGVLYVDEVNLLPDALVDLLLDAAATGQNVVERDGVSHVHPARFVLIGTMNPEEGELRPQLGDRFGLAVAAESSLTPEQRSRIVLGRLEFERDPERFLASFAVEQAGLLERCREARRRVQTIAFAGPGVERAAELCHAAGVDGVRADLAMLRAARAHAAWLERSEISPSDVDAVAEFALAHRRRGPARGAGGGGGGAPSGGGSAEARGPETRDGGPRDAGPRPASGSGAADPGGPERGQRSASSAEGGPSGAAGPSRSDAGERGPDDAGAHPSPSRGALAPIPVRPIAAPPLPPDFLGAPERRPSQRIRGQQLRGQSPSQRRQRGAHVAPTGAIDWFATLLSATQLSAAQLSAARPTRADIRRRPRRLARGGRWVIALDCSASMLDSGALAVAKGVAQALAARAARSSARLALVSFGADAVHARAAFDLGNGAVERAIADLGAAGGTPLGRAIELGLELSSRARADSLERRLIVFTDGRTREDLTAAAAAHPDVEITLIDCELGRLRLGRARRIASALQASYVHIGSLIAGPGSGGDAARSAATASELGGLEHRLTPEPRSPSRLPHSVPIRRPER